MPAKKKSVPAKKTNSTDIALPFDITSDIGGGMESTDRESFAIPMLRVLQKGSQQVDEASGVQLPGAKAGMLYNTVTGDLIDGKTGVVFLPCAYQRRFIQWGPRGGGETTGFHGEHLPEDVVTMRNNGEVSEADGKLYMGSEPNPKKADRLADTRNHFGIVIGENGAPVQVLMSLTSTQIKKSKQLMSMLAAVRVKTTKGMVTPPTWMNRIRITTVLESNDQGSWYGVRFENEGFVESKELYEAGRAFHDTVVSGEARVNYAPEEHNDDKAF